MRLVPDIATFKSKLVVSSTLFANHDFQCLLGGRMVPRIMKVSGWEIKFVWNRRWNEPQNTS